MLELGADSFFGELFAQVAEVVGDQSALVLVDLLEGSPRSERAVVAPLERVVRRLLGRGGAELEPLGLAVVLGGDRGFGAVVGSARLVDDGESEGARVAFLERELPAHAGSGGLNYKGITDSGRAIKDRQQKQKGF